VIFSSLLKLLLVYIEAPLIWFGFTAVVESAFTNIGFWFIFNKNEGSIFSWRFDKKFARSLLIEIWPLILYGVGLSLQNRIDQVMLGNMSTNNEVGQYSIAFRLILMTAFIPTYVASTFTPAISKAKKEDQEKYTYFLLNNYRIMFIVFLVVSIPIFFFGDNVVVILYGKDYELGGVIFSLFAFKLFFTSLGMGKSSFILNESLFKFNLIAIIIGSIVNISSNYFLIPTYGAYGALMATYISFLFSHILVDFFYGKTRRNQLLIFQGIFTFWKVFGELEKMKRN
ncbi:MAG: oligosaccharide flippase family protein, partial [Cytophagales bacterium]|nr:oligosaccharide flippase family protein [Cytophagales bacterium]